LQLAKYQPAFLNRQFILIMCANGVPEQLIIEIFNQAVNSIKDLRKRVQAAKTTKDDHRLITACSEVSLRYSL
jgi:RNA-dependent RNA polymerase